MRSTDESRTRCLTGRALVDAVGTGRSERADTVFVQDGRIERVCCMEPELRRTLEASEQIDFVDLGDRLILPSFVNAHAHLDLAHLGPRLYGGDFVSWAGGVARARAEAEQAGVSPRTVVAEAAQRSVAEGISAVGDIAGTEDAVRGRLDAGLAGRSWLEVFGLGAREQRGVEAARERLGALRTEFSEARDSIDLQPHAPYSAGPALYDYAASTGRPSSHLHETKDELRFTDDGNGPFTDLLKRIGKWDPSIQGHDRTPIGLLHESLGRAPWVLAHLNYVDDEDLERLAQTDVSIAYCPIASEYFGHRDHRYRDMLERGLRVCLGTDSILCQSPDDPQPFGLWSAIRRLFERDRTDPLTLLRMATTNGAEALGLEDGFGTLRVGAPAHLQAIAVDPDSPDPFEDALRSRAVTAAVG